MRNVAIVVSGILIWCGLVFAQFQFGSVVGLVKDSSESPMPGSVVEIRSESTNSTRQATTNSAGEFTFVSLPPDQYTIVVRHAGFRDSTKTVRLSVDQRLEADITLEVSGVTEEVTVNAETPLLESASSELGNVRSEKQVVDLPLNTRNFT